MPLSLKCWSEALLKWQGSCRVVQRMSRAHCPGASRLYLLSKSEAETCTRALVWVWVKIIPGGLCWGTSCGEALLRVWRRMPVLTQCYDLWWWWQWCGEDLRALGKTFLCWVTPGVTASPGLCLRDRWWFLSRADSGTFSWQTWETPYNSLHWSRVSFSLWPIFSTIFYFMLQQIMIILWYIWKLI